MMLGYNKKTDKEIKQIISEEQKESKENSLKWHNYLTALLFILAGLVFILYKELDIPFICMFLAFVFAIAGIVSIVSYCIRDIATGYYRLDLVYGVIAGFAALIFCTRQEVIGTYFPILAGFILFANGVIKLQHSIDMKRIDRKMKKVTEIWLVVMIFALVCIAAGFITIYMTPENNRTMFIFTGIALIVAGASDVFTQIVFNRKVKIFRSGSYITDEKDEQEDVPENTEPVPAEEPVCAVTPEESLPDITETDNDIKDETGTDDPGVNEETVSDATDPQT